MLNRELCEYLGEQYHIVYNIHHELKDQFPQFNDKTKIVPMPDNWYDTALLPIHAKMDINFENRYDPRFKKEGLKARAYRVLTALGLSNSYDKGYHTAYQAPKEPYEEIEIRRLGYKYLNRGGVEVILMWDVAYSKTRDTLYIRGIR